MCVSHFSTSRKATLDSETSITAPKNLKIAKFRQKRQIITLRWDGRLLTAGTGHLTKPAMPGIVAAKLDAPGSDEIQPQMVASCWMELMAKPTCRPYACRVGFFIGSKEAHRRWNRLQMEHGSDSSSSLPPPAVHSLPKSRMNDCQIRQIRLPNVTNCT